MAITSVEATFWNYDLDCRMLWGELIAREEIMSRALFSHIAIGICIAISLGAANAQSVKPKYPGEIAAASDHIAQVNEDCRRQARAQHLHLLKRHRFMRDCKRQ
jgi:hypothetical protein